MSFYNINLLMTIILIYFYNINLLIHEHKNEENYCGMNISFQNQFSN